MSNHNNEKIKETTAGERVSPQITLKDVKKEIKFIYKKVYKEKRPDTHLRLRTSYTNSMDIVLTIKKEIDEYYKENFKRINDDELIKIYDNYVTDNEKISNFLNTSFASIIISTINSLSINQLIEKIKNNSLKTFSEYFIEFSSAILCLIISLIIALIGAKALNRDSYKYEIKEFDSFHKKILSDELIKRQESPQRFTTEWQLKEYKKRNRFLFCFPFSFKRKIKGLFACVFHPFSGLNRKIAKIVVIDEQLNKLENALKETEHLNENVKKPIVDHINEMIKKESEKKDKI